MNLELDASGAITLLFHEMGAGEDAAWGADDEEITVHLDAEATSRMAFALLAAILKGRTDGPRALISLCEAHGVHPEVANWT